MHDAGAMRDLVRDLIQNQVIWDLIEHLIRDLILDEIWRTSVLGDHICQTSGPVCERRTSSRASSTSLPLLLLWPQLSLNLRLLLVMGQKLRHMQELGMTLELGLALCALIIGKLRIGLALMAALNFVVLCPLGRTHIESKATHITALPLWLAAVSRTLPAVADIRRRRPHQSHIS